MTFEQCETELKTQLQSWYDVGEAAAIADYVMKEYTGYNRLQRKLYSTQLINKEKQHLIQAATGQLLQGKPLQYILGYTEFYGLRFQVNESVLIPRPETEELVDWVIKDSTNRSSGLQILDIGTGSGCIPITFKKYLPDAIVTTLDISAAAMETAIRNAGENQAAVQFVQLDFLEESNWNQLDSYDVIVSNPPYIPLQEKPMMDRNVTDWEPAVALFVPDEDPLLFYEKIAAFGSGHLRNGGTIYLEIHQQYATAVQQLFAQRGYTAEVRKDINGNERMVKVFSQQSL